MRQNFWKIIQIVFVANCITLKDSSASMAKPKNTTLLLKQLRALMVDALHVKEPLGAYIVPSTDRHSSEYIADCDERRAYISGFTGSAGIAVITKDHACMWTDGRYFIQAAEEMDDNWTLMKEGVITTPSKASWLSKTLPTGALVGADPNLMSYDAWTPLQTQLERSGLQLVPVQQNLIDLIWPDRPAMPCNPVHPQPVKYSGKTVADKLADVRAEMTDKNASMLVVSALDEIAWMLNLRGSDIPYNPVFFAFLVITQKSLVLFLDAAKYTPEVAEHLKAEIGGASTLSVQPYDHIETFIEAAVNAGEKHVWMPETAAFALTNLVPARKLSIEMTPISLMKAVKNPVEIAGMRNAHVKDGVALCCYFSWLETTLAEHQNVTEISGAGKLQEFRQMQPDFVGLSFPTISSVGPHGAIIHYLPSVDTDAVITQKELYLCDSGGQYRDGTTDVTRTFHFGTPTDFERECFTRVLKGQIRLGSAVFPNHIIGNRLDSFARENLWSVGLDYAHGTGHGIGSFLNVHEGPIEVSWRKTKVDPGLEAGMFISNEPGYYEDGQFGIRLEDIVQIVPAATPHNYKKRGFLTFETITFCPIQGKMIKAEMLTDFEVGYLNKYHAKCRQVLGPLLEQQGHHDAKEWLYRETEPIKK